MWQQPHGRVVWAGTEAASRWPGYFEGAVEAGLAASEQVKELAGQGKRTSQTWANNRDFESS